MDYIKVKDKDHLARDINSNGIINFDVDGYNQYAENYKRVYNESKRINTLENDVSSIRSDLDEIKNLLRNFVNESK
jgi:acyl-[acyl carrier protein]--UDP-N-acetylglucosamine O-acyltransferase